MERQRLTCRPIVVFDVSIALLFARTEGGGTRARELHQHVQVGLHLRNPLKLQVELAPVRAGQFLRFRQPPFEIGDAARSLATLGFTKPFSSITRGWLSLVGFLHQLFRRTFRLQHSRCRILHAKTAVLAGLLDRLMTTLRQTVRIDPRSIPRAG